MNADVVVTSDKPVDSSQGFETTTERALADTVWKTFPGPSVASAPTMNSIDLLGDVPVELSVEVGRSQITIQEVMAFSPGTVMELDGLAGEPLNIFVNGRLIARGETVVVNNKLGIRLTDMVSFTETLKILSQ
jgi:flagellar motor switch protein FliN/FliY